MPPAAFADPPLAYFKERNVYPLLPEIREDFGFSLEQSGLLATGFTLGLAIAGFLAGFVVDRFSRKTVMIGSVLVYSLGTLAVPLASGFLDMSAYRIFSGIGEGVQATAFYSLVVPGQDVGSGVAFAAGFIGVTFGGGIFLGPMIGVPFAASFDTSTAIQRSVRPEHVGRSQGLFMLTYYVAAAFSGVVFARLVALSDWSGAGKWQLSILPLVGAVVLTAVDPKRMIRRL